MAAEPARDPQPRLSDVLDVCERADLHPVDLVRVRRIAEQAKALGQ